ncbi:MAG: hypothetical protein ACK5LX_01340 [Oscillospiraceae bacterium]
MYTRKNKRFAVVLAALLAISMIFSGLTAFADGTPSSSGEETTSSSESTSVEAVTQSAEESSQESSAESSQESSVESSQETSQEESSGESSEEALEESSVPETPEVADGDTVVLGASYTVTVTQPDMGEVKVTYEKDGSEVTVNSGDKVSEGTELTIALEMPDVSDLIEEMGVNPYQFMKVVVNGQENSTDGENPFEMTYTVATEDVAVSVDRGIMIAPMSSIGLVGSVITITANQTSNSHSAITEIVSPANSTLLTAIGSAPSTFTIRLVGSFRRVRTGSGPYSRSTQPTNISLSGSDNDWAEFFNALGSKKVTFEGAVSTSVADAYDSTGNGYGWDGNYGTGATGTASMALPNRFDLTSGSQAPLTGTLAIDSSLTVDLSVSTGAMPS